MKTNTFEHIDASLNSGYHRHTMETRVSPKGLIKLPEQLRSALNIRAGEALDISVAAGRILLTPRSRARYKTVLINDPVSGLPVYSAVVNTSQTINDNVEAFRP